MRLARPALLALLACLAGAGAWASADVVLLTDGTRLEGKVVEQSEAEVVVETTFDGRKSVPRSQLKSLDTRIPPLREQLAYRLGEAGEQVAPLWATHDWAKQAGFKDELRDILQRIVRAAPQDARARKALGHAKVDGRWMSPEEQAAHEQAAHETAMRAKGLVPYEGGWVTPEEKAAREQGLRRDGDEWVTEEEWHRRRGETRVDGRWVRVGEAEGRAYADEASKAARVTLQHLWTPHFDVCHELDSAVGERVAEGLEKAYAEARRVLKPSGDDLPETLVERMRVALFKKAPAYARFSEWLGQRLKIEAQQPGWARAIQRQPAFWWVQDEPTVSVYQFPNIDKTLVSNAVHNAGLVLLTRYRMNFRFPSPWLREGFAYHLEMVALGYSLTFTLGRGGGTNQGGSDTAPPWAESEKWKQALKGAVAAGTDPPLKRMGGMQPEELGYAELVKAWSVVDYLVRRDSAKFKAFVDGAKAARDAPEEEALTAALGLNYRQLDEQWRAWVTGGFGPP